MNNTKNNTDPRFCSCENPSMSKSHKGKNKDNSKNDILVQVKLEAEKESKKLREIFEPSIKIAEETRKRMVQHACNHNHIVFELDIRNTYSVTLNKEIMKFETILVKKFVTKVEQSPFCMDCGKKWTMNKFDEYKKLIEQRSKI